MLETLYVNISSITYLSNLATDDGHIVGLLLGQRTEDQKRAYILHMSQCPTNQTVNDMENFDVTPPIQRIDPSDLLSVKTEYIVDHAKQVTRILPGGMSVLGIFVAGYKNIFENNYTKFLRDLVKEIEDMLTEHTYLCGSGPDKIIMYFSAKSDEILVCKSFPTSGDAPVHLVDCIVKEEEFVWHKLSSDVRLTFSFPVKEVSDFQFPPSTTFRDVLLGAQRAITSTNPQITGVWKKDWELLCDDDGPGEFTVENINPPLETEIFSSENPTDFSDDNNTIGISFNSGSTRFKGSLVSRVFMHKDATVGECIKALREDILRSLASRFELDAYLITEEAYFDKEEPSVFHEPPRRIFVSLPGTNVTVSQYILPGERLKESLRSLQELLDLNLKGSVIEEESVNNEDLMPVYANQGTEFPVVSFILFPLFLVFIAFLYNYFLT